MLFEQFRKKRPTNSGGGLITETSNTATQVPKVDDALAEIDKALAKANKLQQELDHPPDSCSC